MNVILLYRVLRCRLGYSVMSYCVGFHKLFTTTAACIHNILYYISRVEFSRIDYKKRVLLDYSSFGELLMQQFYFHPLYYFRLKHRNNELNGNVVFSTLIIKQRSTSQVFQIMFSDVLLETFKKYDTQTNSMDIILFFFSQVHFIMCLRSVDICQL